MGILLNRSLPALVLAVPVFLPGPSLSAQQPSLVHELAVFAVAAGSDHLELPSPRGFGAASLWELGGDWLARLSFQRMTEETTKRGTVCDLYAPRVGCRTEMTETSVTFSGLRGGILRGVDLGRGVRIAAGAGLSFNQIKAQSQGPQGARADLMAPNTGQIGYLGILSVMVAPLRRVPAGIVGSFTVHRVGFNSCSGEDPPQYDPFCGASSFREIELGLTYSF